LGSAEADTGVNIGNINCPTTATHTINLAVGNGTHRYFAAPIYIYIHTASSFNICKFGHLWQNVL
jgi:hypothetical protein